MMSVLVYTLGGLSVVLVVAFVGKRIVDSAFDK
jgi:hypothetical protein